jgi:hypothetical protein
MVNVYRVGVIGDYFHFQQLFSDVVTIGGMGEEGGINNEWLYVSGALFVL